MNRKGFTLVELLAVIAILAILVIVALPNVLSMYRDAKKNTFTNELKNIYRTAETQWMSDSMFDSSEKEYAKCSDNCPNNLKLSGGNKINYYVKLDESGKITEYYAENGTYQYSYKGPGLSIENIEQVSEIDENNKITISCSGATDSVQQGCRLVNGSINQAGSEVVCGTEHFYVIRVVNNNVRLLAAKNITLSTTNPVQTDTYTPTYFSSSPYWYDSANDDFKSAYGPTGDPNNIHYVYDSNSNLYKYVQKYADVIAGFGVNNISAELIRKADINSASTVNRKDGVKRTLNILGPTVYNQIKTQIFNSLGESGVQNAISTYNLSNVWDYNKLTSDDKIVYVGLVYSLLEDNGLSSASESTKIAAIASTINDMNTTNYNWLPEWMYDGIHYYSGECRQNSCAYPWKESWDEAASYADTEFYGIRPVIIVPTSEIQY